MIPLYKYVPPERVDILENQKIAFTPPQRFNDPFDIHPTFKIIRNRAYARREAKRMTGGHFHFYFPDLPPAEGQHLARQMKRQLREGIFRELVGHKETAEKHARLKQQEFVRAINKFCGVLSLTSNPRSLLMWAHYAASHSGLLLEFDHASTHFKQLGFPVAVHYSPKRPTYDDRKREGHWCALVKSSEWAYENEFRIVRSLQHCEHAKKGGSGIIHLAPLPRQAIKSVYMGVNMTEDCRKRVSRAIQRTSIQLFQMQLSQTNFALEPQPITVRRFSTMYLLE
jgi:Protein of unknown function (DUF2971)